MGYLYKLVDEKAFNAAKNGEILLSRPIFEFKGSEGCIINFAKNIEKRINNIEFTEEDNKEIGKWVKAFRESCPQSISDQDLQTECSIMFYGILSAYCGYFTKTDLDDLKIRKEYIKKNKGLKKKVGYIKIDENDFPQQSHWRSARNEFRYKIFAGDSNDLKDRNGFLHIVGVEYIKDNLKYLTHLMKFNSCPVRKAHYWFSLVDEKFQAQNEKRLIFLTRSLEPDKSTIAAPRKTHKYKSSSINEKIFYIMVDTINYCTLQATRHISLILSPNKIITKSI